MFSHTHDPCVHGYTHSNLTMLFASRISQDKYWSRVLKDVEYSEVIPDSKLLVITDENKNIQVIQLGMYYNLISVCPLTVSNQQVFLACLKQVYDYILILLKNIGDVETLNRIEFKLYLYAPLNFPIISGFECKRDTDKDASGVMLTEKRKEMYKVLRYDNNYNLVNIPAPQPQIPPPTFSLSQSSTLDTWKTQIPAW